MDRIELSREMTRFRSEDQYFVTYNDKSLEVEFGGYIKNILP